MKLRDRINAHRHRRPEILAGGYEVVELACGLDKHAAGELEARYIVELDSVNPAKGFNLLSGGFRGFKLPSSIKKKMSRSALRRPNNFLGKNHSEDARRRMSASKKILWAERGHPLKGRPLPEATKQKISESKMGSVPWNRGLDMSNRAESFRCGWEKRKANPNWQQQLAKMNAARSGKPHPMLGRKHSVETRRKISEAAKRRHLSSA